MKQTRNSPNSFFQMDTYEKTSYIIFWLIIALIILFVLGSCIGCVWGAWLITKVVTHG
jgi:hypothetical protein